MYEVSPDKVKAAQTLILGYENQLVASMLSTNPNELVPVHTDVTMMLEAFAKEQPARFVARVCAFVHDEVLL